MATRRSTTDPLPAAVKKARERFEKWRKTRKPGEKIPDRLWRAAVKATETYSPHKTSRVLRLDYSALKRRMPAGAAKAGRRSTRAKFVEVTAASGFLGSECVAWVEDATGARLRLELRGLDAAQLGTLARSFAEGRGQ